MLALASLGHIGFAVRLLESLWPRGDIESTVATLIIDEALRSGSDAAQMDAAVVLRDNACLLLDSRVGFMWPSSIAYEWRTSVTEKAREALLEAHGELLLCRGHPHDWGDPSINLHVCALNNIMTKDPAPYLRAGAIALLEPLVKLYGATIGHQTLLCRPEPLRVKELASEIPKLANETKHPVTSSPRDVARRLDLWVAKSAVSPAEQDRHLEP